MEFRNIIARTDAGFAYFERLASATQADADVWARAVGGASVFLTDDLLNLGVDVRDVLTVVSNEPLRISIEGQPMQNAADPLHADAEQLYAQTFRRWHQGASLAHTMERVWYAARTPADMDALPSADALRLLTWQLRDAHDELDWLAREVGEETAARIRESVTGPQPPRTPYTKQPMPRFKPWEMRKPWLIYEEIAELQNRDVQDVRTAVEHRVSDGMTLEESLVTEYGAHPTAGVLVGIDLETTGLSPASDYIVDAGWERFDMTGGRGFDAHREQYGVSIERAALGLREATVELNGITAESLAGLVPFQEDLAAQREVMDALSGAVMVAHNANFEKKFLTGNCDGYAEAVRAGDVRILDSRKVGVHSDDFRFRGFRLDDYARRYGALSDDRERAVADADGEPLALDQGASERHLGLEDAHIMMRAMFNQQKALHERYLAGDPVMVNDLSEE